MVVAVHLIVGCSVQVKTERPEAIATSLVQMPPDAATVARALQGRLTGRAGEKTANVQFGQGVGSTIAGWSFLSGFSAAGAELYTYQRSSGGRITVGRLDFEDALGRRASAQYEVWYRRSGDNALVVDDARVSPVYVPTPQPVMFLVPLGSLPSDTAMYPTTFVGLLTFVAERAVSVSEMEAMAPRNREYAVFVFLLDRVSPSAMLEVKISDETNSFFGYKESTRYLDLEGWRVGILAGRFVPIRGDGHPLYVKVVYCAGGEVSWLERRPKLVGLFTLAEEH
jgi:hypothetical protein